MFEPFKTFPDDSYLTTLQAFDPICFGSTQKRERALKFGWYKTGESFPKVYPGKYHNENYSFFKKIDKKIRSKKGIGSFDCRFKTSREQGTPSPSRYNPVIEKEIKEASVPFGSKYSIRISKVNSNPGPGIYNLKGKTCHRENFKYNFGKPQRIYCVETYCVPIPSDICHKCNATCDGDYWHKDFTLFLCHLCWLEEKVIPEIYCLKELKLFKKLRNCSFLHSHEGTTVANRKLTQKVINKRVRLENYLDKYISCYD